MRRASPHHTVARIAIVALVVLLSASPLATASSVALTDRVELTGGSLVTLPNVYVRCVLIILDDLTMTNSCTFENTGSEYRAFIFCQMIDLKTTEVEEGTGTRGNPFSLQEGTSSDGKPLKCRPGGAPTKPDATSFHFGCKLVMLPPGAKVTVRFTSEGKAYQPAPGQTPQASDFQLMYADIINVGWDAKAMGKFDEASCSQVVGQGNSVALTHDAAGVWLTGQQAFVDPTIERQPPDEEADAETTYATYSALPCRPPGLDAELPSVPACPEPPTERPPTDVDLNLFWHESHHAPENETFAMVYTVTTRGDVAGVRVDADPPAGEIVEVRGGEERFGRVRVCAAQPSEECVGAELDEGARLTVRVDVTDPETERGLFFEEITFIQDGVAPRVVDHFVDRRPEGMLKFEVRAEDASTSPAQAVLWTSEGDVWSALVMEPADEILDSASERTFTATAGPFAASSTVRYIVEVHDEVANAVFFGPATVPEAGGGSAAPGFTVLAALVATAFAAAVASRRERR